MYKKGENWHEDEVPIYHSLETTWNLTTKGNREILYLLTRQTLVQLSHKAMRNYELPQAHPQAHGTHNLIHKQNILPGMTRLLLNSEMAPTRAVLPCPDTHIRIFCN